MRAHVLAVNVWHCYGWTERTVLPFAQWQKEVSNPSPLFAVSVIRSAFIFQQCTTFYFWTFHRCGVVSPWWITLVRHLSHGYRNLMSVLFSLFIEPSYKSNFQSRKKVQWKTKIKSNCTTFITAKDQRI